MTQNVYEQAFQELYDAANSILEATYNDEQNAREAIAQLQQIQEQLEQKLNTLPQEVIQSINSATINSANKTAERLQKTFKEADQAAIRAANHYNKTSETLWLKLLFFAFIVLLAVGGSVWIIVQHTIPSFSEIEARRQEIQRLEQNIASLEKRGGRITFINCKDNNKRTRLCFRTNEKNNLVLPLIDNDKNTYRIPWGY